MKQIKRQPKPPKSKQLTAPNTAIRIKLTPQVYEEVWAVYKITNDVIRTADTLNLPVKVVKKLVKHGLSSDTKQYPPLKQRLTELANVASQLQDIETLKEYTDLTRITKPLLQATTRRLAEKLRNPDYNPKTSDFTLLLNAHLNVLKTISTLQGFTTEPPTHKTFSITFQKVVTPLQSLTITDINQLSKITQSTEIDVTNTASTQNTKTPEENPDNQP